MASAILAGKRKINAKRIGNKYSAVKFRQYFRRLKASCEANADANLVMNGIDPISKFLTRKRAIRAELTLAEKPTKEQIFEDPKFHCTKFIGTLESKLEESLSAEDKVNEYKMIKASIEGTRIDDAPNTASEEEKQEVANLKEARRISIEDATKKLEAAEKAAEKFKTSITGEIIDKLEPQIHKWVTGEAYIYSQALHTLSEKTSLQIKTQGAGRLQLRTLERKHNLKTPKTTTAMIYIWDHLCIDKEETVEDFRERWDELLTDMSQAKPDPIIRSKGEKRLKYLEAFERGKRFVEEHKEFKKSNTEILDMEKWFTTLENRESLELLTRHGMNTDGIVHMPKAEIYNFIAKNKADIYNYVARQTQNKKKWRRKICYDWLNHHSCKRGDNCKYEHVDQVGPKVHTPRTNKDKSKAKKPKSQILCKFHKQGRCNKGNKCPYKHNKSGPKHTRAPNAAITNLSAYELADVEEIRQTSDLTSHAHAVNTNFSVEDDCSSEEDDMSVEEELQLLADHLNQESSDDEAEVMMMNTDTGATSKPLEWYVIPVQCTIEGSVVWKYLDLYSDEAQDFIHDTSNEELMEVFEQARIRPDDIQTDVIIRSFKYDLEDPDLELPKPEDYVQIIIKDPVIIEALSKTDPARLKPKSYNNAATFIPTASYPEASAAASATASSAVPIDAGSATVPPAIEAHAEPIVIAEEVTSDSESPPAHQLSKLPWYYGVKKGIIPSVYATAEAADWHTFGVPGSERKKFRNVEDAIMYVEDGMQHINERNYVVRARRGMNENKPPLSELMFNVPPMPEFDSNEDTESDSDDPSGSDLPQSYAELARRNASAASARESKQDCSNTNADGIAASNDETNDAEVNSLTLGPGFFLDLEASEESEEEAIERKIVEAREQLKQVARKTKRLKEKKKELNKLTQSRRDRLVNNKKHAKQVRKLEQQLRSSTSSEEVFRLPPNKTYVRRQNRGNTHKSRTYYNNSQKHRVHRVNKARRRGRRRRQRCKYVQASPSVANKSTQTTITIAVSTSQPKNTFEPLKSTRRNRTKHANHCATSGNYAYNVKATYHPKNAPHRKVPAPNKHVKRAYVPPNKQKVKHRNTGAKRKQQRYHKLYRSQQRYDARTRYNNLPLYRRLHTHDVGAPELSNKLVRPSKDHSDDVTLVYESVATNPNETWGSVIQPQRLTSEWCYSKSAGEQRRAASAKERSKPARHPDQDWGAVVPVRNLAFSQPSTCHECVEGESIVINTLWYDKCGKDVDTRPLLDSGATHHVTPFKHILRDIRPTKIKKVRGVTGTETVTQCGTIYTLPGDNLKGVLILEAAARTVVSTGLLIDQHGGYVILGEQTAVHVSKTGQRTVLGPRTEDGWYRVERLPTAPHASVQVLNTANQLRREQINRLHRNLGHAPANKLRLVLAVNPLKGLQPKDVNLLQPCRGCALGKPRRKPHTRGTKRTASFFGQILHADNTARQPVGTLKGQYIGNVVIDGYTNWNFGKPIKTLDESVKRLRYITIQILQKITQVIRTDQGGEFMGYDMGNLCAHIGARQETAATGDSQQNSKAEKAIQDLMRMTRAALADSGLPLVFWGLAFNYAAFTHNRMPCMANPDTASPYFMRYGKHPDYTRFQPFGQPCTVMYAKNRAPNGKIGKQALSGRMVGYDDDEGTKAYRVYVPVLRKIVISADVTFLDATSNNNGLAYDVEAMNGPPVPIITTPAFPTATANGRRATRQAPVHLVRPPNTGPAYNTRNMARNRAMNRNAQQQAAPRVAPAPMAVPPPVPPTPTPATRTVPGVARAAPAPVRTDPNPRQVNNPGTSARAQRTRQPIVNTAQPQRTLRRSARTLTRNAPAWVRNNGLQSLARRPRRTNVQQPTAVRMSRRIRGLNPEANVQQLNQKSVHVEDVTEEWETKPTTNWDADNVLPEEYYQQEADSAACQPSGSEESDEETMPPHVFEEMQQRIIEEYEQNKNQPEGNTAHVFTMTTNGSMPLATKVFTPKTYKEAINCGNTREWQAAMEEEYANLVKNNMFKVMKKSKLPPGTNIISGRWVYKVKSNGDGTIERFRARLVARGFQAKLGVDYKETFAPVAAATSIRLILAIAALFGLFLTSADFVAAFQNAKLPNVIYFQPPPGLHCNKDEVWALLAALYGLPNSPLLWAEALKGALRELGFNQTNADPCFFFKITKEEYTLVSVVVDDLIVASRTQRQANQLIEALGKYFKVKNLGQPKYVIGVHINYDQARKTLKLNQQLYIENLADKFGQTNCKSTYKPADTNTKLQKDLGSEPFDEKLYRSLIGSLIYATITRPDVAVIISQLSRYLCCPQKAHWKAAIKVLRFLKTTKTKSIIYKPTEKPGNELVVYSDSTWNSDKDTSRSRTGYAVTFCDCLICWKSKLQPMVTLSSTEAEYVALNDAAKEGLWLRRLLQEIKFKPAVTPIMVDNQSTIALAKHKMLKPRTKHIAMRYHWIRELLAAGQFRLFYISTQTNLADLLTKVLGVKRANELLKGLMVTNNA